MPPMYPAAATPGTALRVKSTGVVVKLLAVAGEMCQVKLPDGTWTYAPMRDLEYGFSAETIGDSKGPAIDPRAGSNVGTGPITRAAQQALCDVLNKKASAEDFAKSQAAESARPGLAWMASGTGRFVHRDEFGAGATVILKSTGRPVTVFASAPERDLVVCQMENGSFGAFTTSELSKGDGSALDGRGLQKDDGSLTSLCKQILAQSGDGSLRKMGKAHGSFNRGDRVRLRVAVDYRAAGTEGILKLCGRTAYVEFPDGAGVFEYEQLEAI